MSGTCIIFIYIQNIKLSTRLDAYEKHCLTVYTLMSGTCIIFIYIQNIIIYKIRCVPCTEGLLVPKHYTCTRDAYICLGVQ